MSPTVSVFSTTTLLALICATPSAALQPLSVYQHAGEMAPVGGMAPPAMLYQVDDTRLQDDHEAVREQDKAVMDGDFDTGVEIGTVVPTPPGKCEEQTVGGQRYCKSGRHWYQAELNGTWVVVDRP
jgi:hypothetical protein